MKTYKQNADFLHIGKTLIKWYQTNARQLPWRDNKRPYNIWISEIILQQTQVKQGLNYYLKFIEKFPNINSLHIAKEDEVLLYWKGLGYYSRALNLHKAAHQLVEEYNGEFPKQYNEILKLKGIGKYTAAAIASICFDEKIPAIDGNFYRVLSRIFADNFDISSSQAFKYFSELALLIMPNEKPGDFNQAIMDLGSEICKPQNPLCKQCPIHNDCLAYQSGSVAQFPVKSKKVKISDLTLKYFFVTNGNNFLIRQRGNNFIWKRLYEFPTSIPENWEKNIINSKIIHHKLTHKNLTIQVDKIVIEAPSAFENFASINNYIIINKKDADKKSFPKPLHDYYQNN